MGSKNLGLTRAQDTGTFLNSPKYITHYKTHFYFNITLFCKWSGKVHKVDLLRAFSLVTTYLSYVSLTYQILFHNCIKIIRLVHQMHSSAHACKLSKFNILTAKHKNFFWNINIVLLYVILFQIPTQSFCLTVPLPLNSHCLINVVSSNLQQSHTIVNTELHKWTHTFTYHSVESLNLRFTQEELQLSVNLNQKHLKNSSKKKVHTVSYLFFSLKALKTQYHQLGTRDSVHQIRLYFSSIYPTIT